MSSLKSTNEEHARVRALRRYEILDTTAERAFDDLTRLAVQICETPIALISFVDETRQWFKSKVGVTANEMSRAIAFCAHTIAQRDVLVVADTTLDERFRKNPLVSTAPGIRFYAGVPIMTPEGHSVGTLSVMDYEPRHLNEQQLEALRALGHQAEKQLEVRTYITEREKVARQLRDANQFTSEIISGAGEGIVVFDRAFRYVVWNRFMEELTGLPARQVIGKDGLDIFPHMREQGTYALLQRALAGETVASRDTRYRIAATDRSGWISATYGPHRNANGEITGVIGLMHDVTERRQAEEALLAAEAKFRGLVEQSLVGIYIIQDDRYQYVNPKLGEIFGYSTEELLSLESVTVLASEEDRPLVTENVRRCLEGEPGNARYTFRGRRKSGEQIVLEVHGAGTQFQSRPAVIGSILDVTDRRRAEERIVHQAYHDPLTGLPNRMLLMDRLRLHLAQARRNGNRLVGVLYIDLDGFKGINDTWGHGVGDRLLQTIADRLINGIRRMDTAARVGGDEFVILLPSISRVEDAAAIARKLLVSIAEPFSVDSRTLQIAASIGVGTFPTDGEEPESLLTNADNAMYLVKEMGGNNVQICTPEVASGVVRRLSVQSGLRKALDRGELTLHYQPVVSLVTGRISAFEALVRWQHPENGLVMPADFISVAEDSGLIVPLGEWVLETACRQLKLWQKEGVPDLRIAVNLSARQFRDPGLVGTVERAIVDAALRPEHLEIEITERVAMENTEVTVANLVGLRKMNVGISIDDFGTGYSSLSYLKRFLISSLKIDQSFVGDVATNPADAGIVRAVVEMAHGLTLNVIAEGVETKEQFAHLRQYGCDEMQGYWFSRPVPADAVQALLDEEVRRWTPRT
jgi:diguanylate cyclase (GGDEF)-like protein/PAS domain S-box-containing protein